MARVSAHEAFLSDVLETVYDGGAVDYWASIRYGLTTEDQQLSSKIRIDNPDSEIGPWRALTTATIAKGIASIKRADFDIRSDILSYILLADRNNDAGDIDVEAADVIVQAALFGEIVFC